VKKRGGGVVVAAVVMLVVVMVEGLSRKQVDESLRKPPRKERNGVEEGEAQERIDKAKEWEEQKIQNKIRQILRSDVIPENITSVSKVLKYVYKRDKKKIRKFTAESEPYSLGCEPNPAWIEESIDARIQHWLRKPPFSHQDLENFMEQWRNTTLFLYQVSGGTVSLLNRTDSYKLTRKKSYTRFFKEVAKKHPELNVSFLVFPRDGCLCEPQDCDTKVPVLCFQMTPMSKQLFAPDVQLLQYGYYKSRNFLAENQPYDDIPLESKKPKLYFRGACTGEGWGLKNQRYRIAHTLRENRDTNVRLTIRCHRIKHLVEQWAAHRATSSGAFAKFIKGESPDMEDVYIDNATSWAEALRYRYLLLLDGHGAACQRVYLALRSNSAAIKVEKNHRVPSQLHYFSALKNAVHYLSVEEYNLASIVPRLEKKSKLTARVARCGRQFAMNELSAERTIEYGYQTLAALEHLMDPSRKPLVD